MVFCERTENTENTESERVHACMRASEPNGIQPSVCVGWSGWSNHNHNDNNNNNNNNETAVRTCQCVRRCQCCECDCWQCGCGWRWSDRRRRRGPQCWQTTKIAATGAPTKIQRPLAGKIRPSATAATPHWRRRRRSRREECEDDDDVPEPPPRPGGRSSLHSPWCWLVVRYGRLVC